MILSVMPIPLVLKNHRLINAFAVLSHFKILDMVLANSLLQHKPFQVFQVDLAKIYTMFSIIILSPEFDTNNIVAW